MGFFNLFLGEGKHWTKWSQGSLERQPNAASQAQVVAAIGGTRQDRALKSSCETVLRQACEVEGFTVRRCFGVQRCEGVVFLLWTMLPDMFCLFFQSQCFGRMNRWGVGVDHGPSDGGKEMFLHGKLDGFGVFWMGTPSSRCVFSLVFWVTENIC